MKTSETMLVVIGLGVIVGAIVLMAKNARAAPAQGQLYHPVTNPNGYTYTPVGTSGGGQWSRVTPSGSVEYWADVN